MDDAAPILAPPDRAADPATPRPRLALISTFDELCGIAAYTRALVRQLDALAEVTVLDLDQYLLRGRQRRVRALGDRHIREFAARLHGFDAVNIQLEYGTLGRWPGQVLRRLRLLAEAAPALSVTFHTVLGGSAFPWPRLRGSLLRGRIDVVIGLVGQFTRERWLAIGTYRLLVRLQREKPVHAIVHTRRDAQLLRDGFALAHVHHHPLAFVRPEEAARIRRTAGRAAFPQLAALPAGATLIGSFGFLSAYKGFETAIQALRYLPEDHHLLLFGAVHPQTIERERPIDPYIRRLLRIAQIGQTAFDSLNAGKVRVSYAGDPAALLVEHPESLHRRVHFMGALEDARFLEAMAICDVVVLPYLEVGQSSSGPIAMALEMGCRVLASRTLAFLQLARYHPGRIEFFDIGNFAELAELLRMDPSRLPVPGRLRFDADTNLATYRAAHPTLVAAERAATVPAGEVR